MRCVVLGVVVALVGLMVSERGVAAEGGKKSATRQGAARGAFQVQGRDHRRTTENVEDAFRELPSKIHEVAGFEWGTNISPENHDQGFTHCFLVTFNDAKGRDTYLPHPAHKAFGKVLGPYLDKVLVIDFVAKE